MKLFIAVLVVLLNINTQSAFASVSIKRVRDVYSHLQNVAGYHVVLKYNSSSRSNAYCGPNAIYITQGMLDDLSTDAEIATVLGHELGHFASRHYAKEKSAYNELTADKIGYVYCTRLSGKSKKYSRKQCLRFFKTMKAKYGDEGKDGVHPSWSLRLKNVSGVV